ncbi:hypothetical protein HK405_003801, partial [Cladochytrium tenue]
GVTATFFLQLLYTNTTANASATAANAVSTAAFFPLVDQYSELTVPGAYSYLQAYTTATQAPQVQVLMYFRGQLFKSGPLAWSKLDGSLYYVPARTVVVALQGGVPAAANALSWQSSTCALSACTCVDSMCAYTCSNSSACDVTVRLGCAENTRPGPASSTADDPVSSLQFATLAIHADALLGTAVLPPPPPHIRPPDVAQPLSVSTTYRYAPDWNERAAVRLGLLPASEASFVGEPTQHVSQIYSRCTTDVRTRIEAALGALEKGYATTYASGLAAATAALHNLLPRRVIVSQHGYYGTLAAVEEYRQGREVDVIPLDNWTEASFDFRVGDLVWLESPQNPRGEIYGKYTEGWEEEYIKKFKSLCPPGAYVVVDSTFSPPPLQFCLEQGADMVMHSSTKYLGGHSDLLGGVLVTKSKERAIKLQSQRNNIGNVMGNFEAWLLLRSIRTLELRVTRQSETAVALVAWLASKSPTPHPHNPSVELAPPPSGVIHRVWHATVAPPTSGDVGPSKASAADPPALLRSTGARGSPTFAVSFETAELARLACNNLRLVVNATSLGGVETLIEWRASVDASIDPRVCRVSVGLEAFDDLRADFLHCFENILRLARGTAN